MQIYRDYNNHEFLHYDYTPLVNFSDYSSNSYGFWHPYGLIVMDEDWNILNSWGTK